MPVLYVSGKEDDLWCVALRKKPGCKTSAGQYARLLRVKKLLQCMKLKAGKSQPGITDQTLRFGHVLSLNIYTSVRALELAPHRPVVQQYWRLSDCTPITHVQ